MTRKIASVTVLLFLTILLSGCPFQGATEEEPIQQEAEAPDAIDYIEESALEIMAHADVIYLLTEGDELLAKVLQREMTAENDGQGDDDNGDEQESEDSPSPEEIWITIDEAIASIHEQWDDLKHQLIEENISPGELKPFEETLDNLTLLSAQRKYFETLIAANQLTEYLPRFMLPFAEDVTATAYKLKFHIRNVILTAANGDYSEAQSSVDFLKDQSQTLFDDLEEEDAQETARELETSIDNLETALDKQSLELIKVKATVAMGNVVNALDELE
ncbi:hypothetical protein GGQ84_000068 [Desulfitispora alkaliphila]|uniref:hypothetical protein n=1 Tax=Desulfitispora alkaliphila TaxID=622674 RepID=UPI003D1F1C5E